MRVFHDRGDEAGEDLVDFSIVLGGDGTLLHLASLFNRDREVPVPPCVSFAMGSLGFMTNFDVKDYRRTLAKVLDMEEEVSSPERANQQLVSPMTQEVQALPDVKKEEASSSSPERMCLDDPAFMDLIEDFLCERAVCCPSRLWLCQIHFPKNVCSLQMTAS